MSDVDPEIVAMLDALEARLPGLVQQTFPDELMEVFATEAEAIAEAAGPDDQHPGALELLLAGAADLSQHKMAGIAVKLGIRDRGWGGCGLFDGHGAGAQPGKHGAIGQNKARQTARDQPAARRSAEERAQRRGQQMRQHDKRPDRRDSRQQHPARQAEDPARHRDAQQQPEPGHAPQAPVEPKPPAARAVVRLKASTTVKRGRSTGTKIICAIRSPGWMMMGSDPGGLRFQVLIITSPV